MARNSGGAEFGAWAAEFEPARVDGKKWFPRAGTGERVIRRGKKCATCRVELPLMGGACAWC